MAHSASGGIPADAEIFRVYWIRFGGKRGALTRTAHECNCSLTHVARVLSRHAPKAIPRGVPVQAVNFEPVRIDYVTTEAARPHVTVPPMDIIAYNQCAADYAACLNVGFAALFITVGLLEVWPLVWLLLPFGVALGQWTQTVR